MSKNHIKIFDDTVLKQSINQGTEIQRTASNLGRFTMGELAFTRDTGRVFVGNGSSKDYSELHGIPEILGGILTGNRYLGYIDSKPLSWWKQGEYSSIPLNYDSETNYKNNGDESFDTTSKETYTKESSMLGKDSKYRNKLGKDGNRYIGKWERDSVYNETYDAYNGDYLYDIYQNALILFDTNISERSNNISGVIDAVEDKREQFYDNDGNPLPIDEQYRRTKIQNLNDDYHINHPIYGDGYVIFKNIEVDGKSIKFKEKIFNSDGTTDTGSKVNLQSENYSHNIIEVGEVSADSVIGAFSDNHFQLSPNLSSIELRDVVNGIHGFTNIENSFTLPQILTLSSNPNSDTNKKTRDITFDFTDSNTITTVDENELTLKLTQKVETVNGETIQLPGQFFASVAKPLSSEFYIRLDNGLINSGPGDSDHIKISRSTAGILGENCPKISLAINENLSFHENNLNDPFYTLYESDSGNFYNGNITFNTSGFVQAIDDYDEDYKQETIEERAKFDIDKNIKVNMLKNPLPIMWTGKHSAVDENGEEITTNKFDANLEYIIKPHFYCINKVVGLNGLTTTEKVDGVYTSGDIHNKSIIVLGNNHFNSKNIEGNYFTIPGFNCDINTTVSQEKGSKVLKCVFDAISTNFDDNVKSGQYEEVTIDGKKEITIYNESILTSEEELNPNIYTNISEHIGNVDASATNLDEINSKGYIISTKTEVSEEILDDGTVNTTTTTIDVLEKSEDYYFDVVDVKTIETGMLKEYYENNILNDKINRYFSYKNFDKNTPIVDFDVTVDTTEEDIDDKEIFESDDTEIELSMEITDITENTNRVSIVKSDANILKAKINTDADESKDKTLLILGNGGTNSAILAIKKLDKKIDHIRELYERYNDELSEEEDFVQLDFDEELIAYYDETTQLVWTKVTSYGLSQLYIASLYANAPCILDSENIPTALKLTLDEEGEIDGIEKIVSLRNIIPYYKSFTLYKKPYISPAESDEVSPVYKHYYTIAKEDALTNDEKRYIAKVQLKKGDIITDYLPEEFWNIVSQNNDLKIVNETTGEAYTHVDTSDIINGELLFECDVLTFIIVVENEIETDSTKYYRYLNKNNEYTYIVGEVSHDEEYEYEYEITDEEEIDESDVNPEEPEENPEDEISTISDTDGETSIETPVVKGPAPAHILETTFDIESFVLTPVYWSENGYHTPLNYSDININEKLNDDSTVVIPDHANEVILEVRHMTASNNPVAIFTAKDISCLSDVINEEIISDFDAGFVSVDNPYDENGNLIIPSFTQENKNLMIPNSQEKCLLYSDSNEVTTVRVPLYRSKYESGKMFSLRVSGVKATNTEKLMIRLIGYSL